MFISRNSCCFGFYNWEPFEGVFPLHRLPTIYRYNSLNQVVRQYSPDGDTSWFFYDRLGRLTASQNKEQKENASYRGAANRYSYTKYDGLGRIVEVGEKSGAGSVHTINLLDTTAVMNWLASGTDRQLTKTIYDEPVNEGLQAFSTSRKRVTASIYLENASDTEGDSTLYVYDINGNVKTLVQHLKALVAVDEENGKKRIDYEYDLVSGKVNEVAYQHGKGDQFYYRYKYDADNRVISSLSSRDRLIWTEDAAYTYYLHGPLARRELGHYKVQGVDYAYTLQGWLKGINSDSLNAVTEMGGDGYYGSPFARVSRDVYGFKLGYYNDDYIPIDVANAIALATKAYTAPTSFENTVNQLFNGNISFTTLALSKINAGATTGYSYGYDQLNRLTEMRQHTTGTTGGWSNSNIHTAYSESIAYDANGNILKYLRRGTAATPDMDSMSYAYNRDEDGNIVNNRLNHVRDNVNSANYTVDIDDQSENNYQYDYIGNLKSDVAEGLSNIDWTVYGKIKKIDKVSGSDIEYSYDAGGNRTTKKVYGAADTITYYVRDAQGNVLGIYTRQGSDALRWNEQHLYGSSRLGIWNWDTLIPGSPPVVDEEPIYDSLLLGSRTYELSNHLGNVLSTISDKKIGNDSSDVVNYYIAEVLSQNDYYPFGQTMPGRRYSTRSYRYGYNGKELDKDISNDAYDYGMRISDQRLGRFLSVDPITKDYPELTPYQYASNSPVGMIDLDGLEGLVSISGNHMPGPTFRVQFDVNGDHIPDYNKGWAAGLLATPTAGLLALDVATGANVSKTVFYVYSASEAAKVFEHNRAKTPEGRAAQDQRSAEGIVDATTSWGLGKILGVAGQIGLEIKKPISIALGLTSGKQLENFAKTVDALHVGQWEKNGLYTNSAQSFQEAFKTTTEKVIESGGKIKFDLTGFDIKKAMSAKGKSLYDEGVGYTDWEFNQIIADKKLLKAAEFYENNKLLKTDDVIKKTK